MTRDEAAKIDRADSLQSLRERFVMPEGLIYLDGNSLGPLPTTTIARIDEVVEREWGDSLIRGWNAHGWIEASQRVGAKLAPLVGARPNEVLIADSTSVNLFKLLVAAAKLSDRHTLLSESGNFHTDLHIASGVAELLGLELEIVPRGQVLERIGDDTNLVLLTHVHYRSGERYDLAEVTRRAREAGARVVWDLSHSVGAVPLALDRDGAELAVGCGYKYLNGGPGAPAFLYVAEPLHERMVSPLRGWMGHAAPFDFTDDYVPARGIDRFLAGTPPILGIAALERGISSFDGVTMEQLWQKSIALFEHFHALVSARCPELECITPTEAEHRGSHISFRHPHAFELSQALIAEAVIGDFRAPDVIRFGLAPLYLGFEDLWTATERMADILASGRWREPRFAVRGKVT